jgi:uncharacterized damage-inducible protein DinB
MNTREIAELFDYNYWANSRILAAARRVSESQFMAPSDFPLGGLRGTLVHTFDAERSWRLLLEKGLMSFDDTSEADFPALVALEKRWKDEEIAMGAYLGKLKDEEPGALVKYTTDSGVKRERVLWHCLFHVVNHGTQHRSEAAAILTKLGQSPGDMDFTLFLNERK